MYIIEDILRAVGLAAPSTQSVRCRSTGVVPLWWLGLLGACLLSGCWSSGGPPQTKIEVREARSSDGRLFWRGEFYITRRGEAVEHGKKVWYYDNGQPMREAWYAYGKMDGPSTEWYLYGGARKTEGQFGSNLMTGRWIHWFGEGRKAWEALYSADKLVGTKRSWYYSGELWSEEDYDWGRITAARSWYRNGGRLREEAFKDGVKHGPARYWTEDGELLAEGIWREGKPWDGVCLVTFGEPIGTIYIPPAGFAEYRSGDMVRKLDIPIPKESVIIPPASQSP